tara:strand:+ start:1982 stop:3238 length:1257 start_codon:yes stop_codon:yes gene_type:complete
VLTVKRIKESQELPKLLSVFIDQFFMSITTFGTTIVLARTFDKFVYADFVLLISISLFVLGLQSSLISKPFSINISDYLNTSQTNFFQFNLQSKLIFTLAFILIFPIVYFLIFKDIDIKRIFFFTLFITSFSFYFFIRETMLSMRHTRENMFYGLACSISILAILTIIWTQGITDAFFYFAWVSLIYLCLSFIYFFRNFRNFKIPKIPKIEQKEFLKVNWKPGKWLVGTSFLYYLSVDIYPWLLLYQTTKNDVAMLGVLASIASLTNPILKALSSYLLPLYVRVRSDIMQIRKLVKNWTFFFGFISLLLILIGYYFGENIILLFFGAKYGNVGNIVIYPFVLQAIVILFQPFRIALTALNRTDIDFWIYIPRSIIAVGLGYVLVGKFGIYGVFYTMIVETFFYQIMLAINYFIIAKKV